MLRKAARASAWAVALLVLAVASQAQPPTNRDRSDFTDLREPGYPVKAAETVVKAGDAKLRDAEMVLGVALGAEARAYPLSLMWGPEVEVVNDTLGGRPITATWCPLAHSAVVYDRRLGAGTLELGNRGVDRGALVLYDRGSGSWWSQVVGECVRGSLKGQRLAKLPVTVTSWGRWRGLHPGTTVFLDPAVAFRSRFTEDTFAHMTFGGEGPLRNEDWIVGFEAGGAARVWPVKRLAGPRVLNDDSLAGAPIVVVLCADDATVRVYSRRIGDRVLRFGAQADQLKDEETGSRWDALTGRALSGPLQGRELEAVTATSALWYAWKAYRPASSVWGDPVK